MDIPNHPHSPAASITMPSITPLSYPQVWDAIIAAASIPTLFSLRATCSDLRRMVNTDLCAHLSACGSFEMKARPSFSRGTTRSSDRQIWPIPQRIPKFVRGSFTKGFFLAHRPDGDVRMSIAADTAGRRRPLQIPLHALQTHCAILEVDVNLTKDEAEHVGRLVKPRVLRLTPMRVPVRGVPPEPDEKPSPLIRGSSPLTYIPAHVAICCNTAYNLTAQKNGDRDVQPVQLHAGTRRLVIHQLSTPLRRHYLTFRPGNDLREVVIHIFTGGFALATSQSRADQAKWYLSEFLPMLRGLRVVIVGLKDNYPDTDFLANIDGTEMVEMRTEEEHRAAIGEKQWVLEGREME